MQTNQNQSLNLDWRTNLTHEIAFWFIVYHFLNFTLQTSLKKTKKFEDDCFVAEYWNAVCFVNGLWTMVETSGVSQGWRLDLLMTYQGRSYSTVLQISSFLWWLILSCNLKCMMYDEYWNEEFFLWFSVLWCNKIHVVECQQVYFILCFWRVRMHPLIHLMQGLWLLQIEIRHLLYST